MNENTFYSSPRETQDPPEIGCYGLAGHSASPRDLLDEVRLAERLGIGSVFLSERFNVKDAAVLAGAAAAESHHKVEAYLEHADPDAVKRAIEAAWRMQY